MRQERRGGVRLAGEDLLERRAGLGRLAEPPGHAAQAEARLRERRVGRDRRAQRPVRLLEVLADLASVEQLGPAPPRVRIDEGLVPLAERLTPPARPPSPRSSRGRGASPPSRESRAGPAPPSRAPRPSGSRPAPGRPSPRTTGGRRRGGRRRPSAAGRPPRPPTPGDGEAARCGGPCWAQSLWSIRAALTGNLSHVSAARHRWQARAFFQRALKAVISSRRRRSDQAPTSATAPSRSPDW